MAADLRDIYVARVPLLDELAGELEHGLGEALESVPHIDRVYFRSKVAGSFVEKAARYTNPLTDIEDQIAGRVLVFFSSDIDVVSEIARARWGVVEAIHKEPAMDAEFGYETRHHVFIIPEHLKRVAWNEQLDMPTTFELQVRTLFMHAYAEPQHDFGYKEAHEMSRATRRQLAWIASSAWGADRAFEELRRDLA